MSIKSIEMAWIVVNDLKKAVQFYTQVVGMTLKEECEEYGWAELSGKYDGTRLGIAQKSDETSILPGQNAIITLTVDNIEKAKKEMSQKGAKMVGELQDCTAGHVKLQLVRDSDGNHFQLVEKVEAPKQGCCCG